MLAPLVAFFGTVLLFQTVFLVGVVPSASMEPILHAGDPVLGVRLIEEIRTGDIIVFRHEGKLLVKRVAATEGENVIRGGDTLTVPAGSFYVLGDNAENSLDSRYWEDPFVQSEDVLARVFGVE